MGSRIVAAAVVLLTAPAWAACSLGAGTLMVAEDDLEEQISSQLEAEVGTRPDRVDCPAGLKGEVDAEQRCTLTHEGEELGVDVLVTEVEDKNVNFSIHVAERKQ